MDIDEDGRRMHSFQHLAPPLRLFQGAECFKYLVRELERQNCRRAMIFCGSTISSHEPLLALVTRALGDRCVGVFTGVRAHSPAPAVQAGARELERLRADALIAIGGGSAIVTARAANILLAEKGDLADMATGVDPRGVLVSPKLNAPKLPQFVIPTTPTTASVKAGSAVFDPVQNKRLPLFDPKTRAQAVFLHPEFLASAPFELVLSSGLNTLSLAIEGLLSRSGDPLADASLIHAVRVLAARLPAMKIRDDVEVRAELCVASILCGRGTDHTGAGATTVLGHALSAGHNVDVGLANAIVLPQVLRFNAAYTEQGLAKVASAFGASTVSANSVIAQVETLLASIDTPKRLRDLSIARDSLPKAADDAMSDWFLRGNPRPVHSAAELLGILDSAW